MGDRIEVSYFSDVLCVWAFVAQIRLDELQRHYGDTIVVHYHFLPIFADTRHRIGSGWKRRGGFEGYAKHVAGVADGFDHVDVADDVWSTVRPTASFLSRRRLARRRQVASAAAVHWRPSCPTRRRAPSGSPIFSSSIG